MHIRRLDDEVAYITGASAGIGRATALSLAQLGAAVVLGARRLRLLVEVKREIEEKVPGARVVALPLDVRDEASLDRWLLDAGTIIGPPTIVMNNAGLALGRDRVEDVAPERMDTVFDTNVRAVFALTKRVIPGMKERQRGDVIFLGSIAASEPYASGSVYCASKAAIHALARSLRAELLGTELRVLTFDPGLVETEFSRVRFGGDEDKARQVYQGLTPLTAEDVADCVVFAVTRPLHVNIDRMEILAQAQLGTQSFFRR